MSKPLVLLTLLTASLISAAQGPAQQPRFRVLAFYSASAEPDHVQFAEGALKFFSVIAAKDNFAFEATTNWADLNESRLKQCQLVIWLNESPTKPEQRRAFQQYIEAGGAWLGFHAAGYNDKDTNWPWFVEFLGGAVFHINSWPPLPARLTIDDRKHPATKNLPAAYESPSNEWYVWKPSPRLNRDVKILVTLDPSNYPIGFKDILTSGDLPAVWTNTKYHMIYMNMGHGDKIFASPVQNQLIEDATIWLGTNAGAKTDVEMATKPTQGMAPAAAGIEVSPRAVVINPKTHKVYAVNSEKGTVMVINGSAEPTTVAVGTEPEAIAVNSVTNKIYVGNSGSGSVSVIDGVSNVVTATVKVGDLPCVVAANPATNKIYVSKTFSNTVTVIDGATNATTILKAGVQADAIAVNSITNKLYLISYESKEVTIIDGATDNITTVAAGRTHFWGIAVNSETNKVYLANAGNASVSIIDGATNAVTSVNIGDIPCAIAVDAAANKIYAANYADDSVTVIDGASNSVVATVKVGSHPQGLAINPQTHRVYLANTHSDSVTVIDGKNNSVIKTVKTGQGPYAVAVDSASNKVYVATIAGDNLTVIDGR
ncbi:MAG: ThuA domain-containing protein [Candidatus Sulfotelmatobacter sp.]